MSVARCMSEVGAAEFAEWIAYYQLQPWGNDRDDLRAGMLLSLTANINRQKGKRPVHPDTFFPNLKEEGRRARRMSVEEMQAACRQITWQMGGKFETAPNPAPSADKT